jgi:hypothetical protein
MKKIEYNKWYNIDERQPPIGKIVILCAERSSPRQYKMAKRVGAEIWVLQSWGYRTVISDTNFTHWMLILPPTKEVKP